MLVAKGLAKAEKFPGLVPKAGADKGCRLAFSNTEEMSIGIPLGLANGF
jgi:hypothetical protein